MKGIYRGCGIDSARAYRFYARRYRGCTIMEGRVLQRLSALLLVLIVLGIGLFAWSLHSFDIRSRQVARPSYEIARDASQK